MKIVVILKIPAQTKRLTGFSEHGNLFGNNRLRGAEMLQEIQIGDMDVNFRKLVEISAFEHEILVKSGNVPIARIIPFQKKRRRQEVKIADEKRGQKMATILEELSKIKAFSEITDPCEWEKEIRRDRFLPERNDAD